MLATALRRTLAEVGCLALVSASAGAAPSVLDPVVTQLSTSGSHTCVLTTAGGVMCWGRNDVGQLGDNTTTQRATPVDVSGMTSGIAAIAAGPMHTCALTTAGTVKCWGRNDAGQLGDNSTINRATPVDVAGLANVAAVAAGNFHTCALTTGGGVKCWGGNSFGQIGDYSTTQRPSPTDVPGLMSGTTAIAAGGNHNCALTTAGSVQCWGSNGNGQIGDGSTTTRLSPAGVTGVAIFAAVAAGDTHTCARTTAGGVQCWGRNDLGQLGDATTTQRLSPVDVRAPGGGGTLSNVAAVAAGTFHACALTASGGTMCWGDNNFGELGDNTTVPHLTPAVVAGLASGVGAIASGFAHTCALITTGGVKCWGANFNGQVGDNTTTQRLAPVEVAGLTIGARAITAGREHTCAITNDGGAKCWGNDNDGQLGNLSFSSSPLPVDVRELGSGVAALTAGEYFTCGVSASGGASCWGANQSGQLGAGLPVSSGFFHISIPQRVLGLTSGIAAVAAGGYHACALTTSGAVKCWGRAAEGQVGGNYSAFGFDSPIDVAGLASGVAAIAAGGYHTCALTTAGGVKCLGSNTNGQLGDNSILRRNVPVDVTGLASGVAYIAAGAEHTCALTVARGVKCWGRNLEGQLGDNSTTNRLTPVDVAGLASGVAAIAAGAQHTCALLLGGGVKCWGHNAFGQLGDNSTTTRLAPVDVTGLASGAYAIAASGSHTHALVSGGSIKSWGSNSYGQQGNNSAAPNLTPIDIRLQQSIAFTPPATLTAGVAASLAANATSAVGVTFDTWTPSTCSVSGSTVSPIAVGLCGVRASQHSGSNFAPAPQQLRLITVVTGPQSITFDALAARTYGPTPFNVSGSASSGLPLVFAALSPSVCSTGGSDGSSVTMLASGTCTIVASQPGNASYYAAGPVLRSFTVALASQAITFALLPDKLATDPLFTVTASADSGLAVTFHSKTDTVCTVRDSNTIALVTGGLCTLGANQAGDARYQPAPQVSRSFTVTMVNQTISFAALPDKLASDPPFPVTASATSNLAVTFFTSGPCSVTGNTVTIVGAGGCVIFADQAGGGHYNAAPQVNRGFTIRAAYALSVARSGAGIGAVRSNVGGIDCGATCSANFGSGTAVTLTAKPDAGSVFDHWTGCDGVAADTCSVTMTASRAVTAFFRSPLVVNDDWNADGKPDLIWSNTTSGATYVWYMNGPVLISDAFIATIDPSWKVQGVADFNGDGKPDIVWRNTANGNTYVWYMDGPAFVSDAFLFGLPPEWVIQGVADFNKDGRPDFLMRNVVSGNAFAWFFNDATAIGDQFLFNVDPSWKVEGVADFNADGQPDLLFRNTSSGLSFAWFTQYSASTLSLAGSTAPLYSIDPVWEVVQAADWNLDGQPDLVFRNATTGLVFVWYMNGTSLAGSDFIIQIDPSWEIVPRR